MLCSPVVLGGISPCARGEDGVLLIGVTPFVGGADAERGSLGALDKELSREWPALGIGGAGTSPGGGGPLAMGSFINFGSAFDTYGLVEPFKPSPGGV